MRSVAWWRGNSTGAASLSSLSTLSQVTTLAFLTSSVRDWISKSLSS